jgi:hypothetical protein
LQSLFRTWKFACRTSAKSIKMSQSRISSEFEFFFRVWLGFWPRSQSHLLDRTLRSKISDRSGKRVEMYRPYDRNWFNLAQKDRTFFDIGRSSSGVADIAHEIPHSAFFDWFGVLAIFLWVFPFVVANNFPMQDGFEMLWKSGVPEKFLICHLSAPRIMGNDKIPRMWWEAIVYEMLLN